jgi:hypothetical protein
METFVRGASLEAIVDANRKVDRCLRAGAMAMGAAVEILVPVWGDFNEDLCRAGPDALFARLLDQLAPDDVLPFLRLQGSPEGS